MKRIVNTAIHYGYLSLVLLIVRIGTSGAMLTHGLKKLNKLSSGEPIQFADPIGIGQVPSLYLTVFAEVICSFLLILGLFTRLAVIPLLITMMVVIFIAQKDNPFGDKELPMLYAFTYLILMVTGPGKYSVDAYLATRLK